MVDTTVAQNNMTAPANVTATPTAAPAVAATAPTTATPEGSATSSTQPVAPVAPAVTIKLPDGALLDKASIDRLTEVATAKGITTEAAQAVAELMDKALVDSKAAQDAEYQQMRNDWLAAIKSDAEMGGAKFDANTAKATQVLDRFASPELRAALNNSGLGEFPEFMRMLVKIGAAMGEDGEMIRAGSPVSEPVTAAEVMYGKSVN